MKKMVLHSDQVEGETEVDEAFLELVALDNPKIGYIPSKSDLDREYFGRVSDWYGQFGVNSLLYFDLDQEFDKDKIDELLECDAIHLSGGNTYYFLHLMKKRGFLEVLKEFVERGGVLIGVSAGSIIMSETISITEVDDGIHGDQNIVGLEDLSSLGLNDFDFFPHFQEACTEPWR